MRWQNREQSSNLEDRRGRTIKRVGGGIGIGAILMAVFALIMGENPLNVLQQFSNETTEQVASPTNKQEEALADFVGVVLKETETVWTKLFREQLKEEYVQPKLVLYRGEDNTGCGYAQSTTGPFYCPADQRVYIDLSFYEELQTRFKAPGDFAMAYIIAHEVGHHVQYLMGITSQVENQRQRLSQEDGNKMSVAMELQADFLAGVWAHHTQKMANLLEKGDIEEALNAASSVGDDRIQMEARGYVVPDAFTHGTSAQRMFWFKKGFETGDLRYGDTFKELNL
ncbi:MAG: neutral zinc metallopeptidase [Saprospiraceae bacterium]|nr:neutral zinc metallopeptidase [Saprospiraceae bacterium]